MPPPSQLLQLQALTAKLRLTTRLTVALGFAVSHLLADLYGIDKETGMMDRETLLRLGTTLPAKLVQLAMTDDEARDGK